VLLLVFTLAGGRGTQFDSGAIGTEPEGITELEAFDLADELDDVAAGGAGSEAVPGAATGIDDEGGSALAVEWTASLPVAAGLFEFGDVTTDSLDDIETGFDVVNGGHDDLMTEIRVWRRRDWMVPTS
jgi:hypothetical protein